MSPKAKQALEVVREKLATETAPDRISKQEYLWVCEELSSDLDGFMDATRGELEAEKEGEET